jgi:RluA family pseudouridine synthase
MFPILFKNDDLIAVNKPVGLASIPGPPGEEDLLSRLAQEFPEKLYVVHRLDKEASGVILFARNAAMHRYLNEQFSGRSVQKTYLAVTHGVIKQDDGLIDLPLREFGSGRMGVDPRRGKPSETRFRVLERLAGYTLVEAQPITGRRHQLRVHFYSLGHPLVGDVRYGDKTVQRSFPRLMLHAREITFRLPSQEIVTIEAPVPEAFDRVVEGLRHGSLPAKG